LPREPANSQLPFVNPPFTLPPFSLLAHLPYTWSFALWLAISLALYTAGTWLIVKTAIHLPQYAKATALPLALAFSPFIVYCWGLGQLSAIGVFCLALAIYFERTERAFLCGLALSLCLYKPPLLVLMAPMLLFSRRFRALVGLILGLVSLTGISA